MNQKGKLRQSDGAKITIKKVQGKPYFIFKKRLDAINKEING